MPVPARNWVAALQRFVRAPSAEHCELCSAVLASQHTHLVEPANRRLLCACEACAFLLAGSPEARYRRVPRDAEALPGFYIGDNQWEAMRIPIGLAFFFYSSPDERVVALYPGAAGATESRLELQAWADLVAANPVLDALEPDVEALLVNRVHGAREYFRVPIDRCYELVGLIRSHWRGFSGGTQAWAEIEAFLAKLRGSTSAEPGAYGHA